MEKKFIQLAFDDERAKDIAEVIGNKTCQKILDFLIEKEATISEISRGLKIPLNTADYNVKKLVKAGLIEKASWWWSVKGKKMLSYKVSNKKIIISPKKVSSNVKTGIFSVLATGLVALVVRGVVKTNEIKDYTFAESEASTLGTREAMSSVADASAGGAVGAGIEQVGVGFLQTLVNLPAWQWFLIGAWSGLILFFGITLMMNKLKKGGKK